MAKRVWLTYDLQGTKGDYEALFTWLANQKAQECGDGVATFLVRREEHVAQTVLEDLRGAVTLTPRDRVYLVWYDEAAKKIRGKFLSGGRKPAPWAGYGGAEGNGEDEG
jgi:hypothetical protein